MNKCKFRLPYNSATAVFMKLRHWSYLIYLDTFITKVILLAGVGYHLYIVKNSSCIAENILEAIKRHVPEVQLESNVGAELSFVLPKEQSAQFEQLFTNLEQNQDSLGIDSFGVSVTTLEEVFLK